MAPPTLETAAVAAAVVTAVAAAVAAGVVFKPNPKLGLSIALALLLVSVAVEAVAVVAVAGGLDPNVEEPKLKPAAGFVVTGEAVLKVAVAVTAVAGVVFEPNPKLGLSIALALLPVSAAAVAEGVADVPKLNFAAPPPIAPPAAAPPEIDSDASSDPNVFFVAGPPKGDALDDVVPAPAPAPAPGCCCSFFFSA
jgi:hypothetical protein